MEHCRPGQTSVTTECVETDLERTAALAHPHCVLCGRTNEHGCQLDFTISDDEGVEATFDCDARFEGYEGVLHGGVVASLMDAAMTNCLFAQSTPAVTVGLAVRFRHPVNTGRAAIVRARVERSSPPRHVLKAEVLQDGQIRATAEGRFLEQPQLISLEHQPHETGVNDWKRT